MQEIEMEIEEKRMLARLKRMVCTANVAAEKKNYIHSDIELGVIRRVMESRSLVSISPGMERIVGYYYEKMTGRKPYY